MERIEYLRRAIAMEFTRKRPCYIAIECMRAEIEVLQKRYKL